MRCMTPSTRTKPNSPVIHEPALPSCAAIGSQVSPDPVEPSSDQQEALEPVSMQSQYLLTVPVTCSNELLLHSSSSSSSCVTKGEGDSSSTDGTGANISYPPTAPQNPNASPWAHLNSSQRQASSSTGEDWWRISQSAV